MGCFNSCHDIHRLCDECRAEFESLLDQLHQEQPDDEIEAIEAAACACALPWSRTPCSNTANPADPDGYCAECRAAVDECDRTGPEWDR